MYNKELQKIKEELKKLRKPIYNVNVKHKESLSALEKIAVKVTDSVGSMGFFLIIFYLDPDMAGLEYPGVDRSAV